MQNIIHSLLKKFHCTIMLPIFILIASIAGIFYFLVPLIVSLIVVAFVAYTAKTHTDRRIGVFITLALFSGVFAGMVITVEPWIMVGMFIVATTVFLGVRFPAWVATWLIIVFLVTIDGATHFPSLIIPTTFISCLAALATYLMCQEKEEMSKA